MSNFFGIEVDIEHMSLRELEEAQENIRDILACLEHQISIKKKSESRYFSMPSTPH